MVAVAMGARTFLLVLLWPTAWGLMVARCPEGWEAHGGTDQCYYVHSYNRHRTFSDARNYCKAKGGDLAIINSAGLRDWLGHLIAAAGNVIPDYYLWVGAQNVGGSWQWTEDNTPVDNEILPWEGTGSGDCAALTINSKLIKKDCNEQLRFICHRNIEIPLACDYANSWTEHRNHCYKTSLGSNSWHDSEMECVFEGGHLATIETEAEQQLAVDFADKVYNKLWIGYSEEGHPGSFQWVDDSTSNRTFWQDDQPDLSLHGFGAAVVDNDHSFGYWKVEKITTDYHSVCEKEKGSCLPGWEVFESSCYYFNIEAQDTLVWEDANKTCTDVGAALVVLDIVAEDTFFRTHMPETDTLWLGLYSDPDADTLYWTDGTTMDSKNFTFMTEGDEASAIGKPDQQCVFHQVKADGGTLTSSWVPTDCHIPRHYACEAPMGKNLTLIPPSNERFCPNGWKKNGQFCYMFYATEKTWTAAQRVCKNLGADLVSITTWSEQDYVHNNELSGGWIGLNDRDVFGEWVWSDGHEVTIENWAYEPQGDVSCAVMLDISGKWTDLSCDDMMPFACKMDAATSPIGTLTTTTDIPDYSTCGYGWTENPITDECYRIVVQELSFQDARLHCLEFSRSGEQSRPDLVSITSGQEQNFVFGLVAAEHLSQASLWIGMQNTWEANFWTDGSPSSYFNFDDYQPNDPFDAECIEISTGDGRWQNANCYERHAFLCERKGENYVGPQPPPPPQVTCPDGWSFWNNHCYYISDESTDWFTAETRCKSMLGSNLASVTNIDESSYLYIELVIVWRNAWIGLRDDDNGKEWHWTDGSLYYWTNWGDGEPSNTNGNEHCGEIRTTDLNDGRWNDAACSDANYYVCEIDIRTCPQTWTYDNGKCYYVSEVEVTRNEGLLKCQEFNSAADLVNIHSAEENKYFSEQVSGITPACWMGLKYDGSNWVWNDGQGLQDYENWNTGEPNNMETELCGEMISGGDNLGKWNNLACGESRPFGCEIYPTHVVGCEDGWHEFGDYCYWYSNADYNYEYVTFSQARAKCQEKGGDLASIHSAEENDFVYSILDDGYYHIFIGLSDELHQGVMTWSDSTDVTFTDMQGIGFELYYPSCSAFYPTYYSSYGYWTLISCSETSFFLCKKPRQSQPIGDTETGCALGDQYHVASCYNFPETTNTWDDAKSDCESRGHHLVVLEDQFEAAYVSALVGTEGRSVWLGLYGTPMADGSLIFSWVNGAEVIYDNWDRYQPNPDLGECVIASGEETNPGLWSVRNCQASYKYVCEYERVGYTTHPPPTTKPPTYFCLYGWDHLGSSCYKVMHEVSTWAEGEQTCATFGGHLVSIGDVAEHTIVQTLPDLAIVADRYSSVWVGLKEGTDTGYEWTDGTPFDYVDWAPGQPDDHHGQERCVSANVHSLKLSDTVCLAHLPFICEAAVGTMVTTLEPLTPPSYDKCSDDTSWYLYGDHCYKFISVVDEAGQSWEQSRKLCRQDGGELASILTFEENYWLESMIAVLSDTNMWIGGRALLGVGFEWIDGEPFSYNNWAKGEPNNVNDQEDCVSIYNTNEGYWNDQNCGHTEGRICKRPHGQTKPPARTTTPPPGHCPAGWVHAGTNCLYFLTDQMNFTISRKVCQNMGNAIDMISVHSASEQAYLMAALGVIEENMWLGMSYESGFHWVDQTDVTYLNWGPGEPNGANTGEGCVEVSPETGLWNDISCSLKFRGICMMTQDPDEGNHQQLPKCPAPFNTYTAYNGACYKTVSTEKSWQDAEDTCVAEGAHLASILSLAEDSFVWAAGLQSSFSNMWVGLNNIKDQHVFKWTDGWPTVYTNWDKNISNERCVSVSMADGRWSTQKCDSTRAFTCKYSNDPAPTPDPPTSGHCYDKRWQDFGGSSCYLVPNVSNTWSDASFHCSGELAYLVSIHSKEEMQLVTAAMQMFNEPFWIGLQETLYGPAWSDGSSLDFFNWQDGEPNDDEERCTEALARSGVWNDVFCDVQRQFMCKAPKTVPTTAAPPPTPTATATTTTTATATPIPTTTATATTTATTTTPATTTTTTTATTPTTAAATTTATTTSTGTTTTTTTTTTSNPGNVGGLGAGGIVGIVFAVLFVMVGVGFVGFTYIKKKPKKATYPDHNQHHELDTVVYNKDNAAPGASKDDEGINIKGVLGGTDA